MATMNVSLPDGMKAWVEEQVRSERYGNSSDYVRDLIRRDQERRAALESFQAEIDKGLASGPGRPFDMAAFLARKRAQHGG